MKETVQEDIFAMSEKPSTGLKAADYTKPDLAESVTTKCNHLTQSKRNQLLTVLQW